MLSKLKQYQIFWNLAGQLYHFLPNRRFKKMPQSIFIDVTNACNLRCPVCPTHLYMTRAKGFMDLDLFKSIIDEFKSIEVKPNIYMYFAGEPLLHPQIDEIVSYAEKNGHHVFISTNATVLTRELAAKLIKAGLTSIHLCLDGFSKQSHEAHRIESNFEEVKKNIENFLSVRRELNSSNPEVFIQTLITSYSENEMEDIKNWARNIGADAINFKSLSLGSSTTAEQKIKYSYLLPSRDKFRRKSSHIYKTLCSWPRDNAVVYWNGDLGLCCIDFNGDIKMFNIKKDGFIKTFNSKEAVKIRKAGLQKRFNLCQRCSLSNADFMGITIGFRK